MKSAPSPCGLGAGVWFRLRFYPSPYLSITMCRLVGKDTVNPTHYNKAASAPGWINSLLSFQLEENALDLGTVFAGGLHLIQLEVLDSGAARG